MYISCILYCIDPATVDYLVTVLVVVFRRSSRRVTCVVPDVFLLMFDCIERYCNYYVDYYDRFMLITDVSFFGLSIGVLSEVLTPNSLCFSCLVHHLLWAFPSNPSSQIKIII